MTSSEHTAEHEIAGELRLRAGRPQVARLSRRVLVTLAACSSIAIAGAVAYGMTSPIRGGSPARSAT